MPVLLVVGGLFLFGCVSCTGVAGALWCFSSSKDTGNTPVASGNPLPDKGDGKGGRPPVNPRSDKGDGKGGRPPVNPPPNPDVIKGGARRVALECKDSEVKRVLFAAPETSQAVVVHQILNAQIVQRYERFDLHSGKRLGQLDLPMNSIPYSVLSPDGTRLAVHDSSNAFQPVVHVWSLTNNQALVSKWDPYRDRRKGLSPEHELTWMAFLDANRLLTATRSGVLDLWSIPQRQSSWTVRTVEGNRSVFLNVSPWNHVPLNVAISPDRRTVAIFNTDGFSLHDAATGKKTGQTASLADQGRIGNQWGVAFSPDGTRLAALFTMQLQASSSEVLVCWDCRTGQKLHQIAAPKDTLFRNGLSWWGSQHIHLLSGTMDRTQLVEANTGRLVCTCGLSAFGIQPGTSHDGRHWYATSQVALAPAFLAGLDCPTPAEFTRALANPGGTLRLSPDGIRRQP